MYSKVDMSFDELTSGDEFSLIMAEFVLDKEIN